MGLIRGFNLAAMEIVERRLVGSLLQTAVLRCLPNKKKKSRKCCVGTATQLACQRFLNAPPCRPVWLVFSAWICGRTVKMTPAACSFRWTSAHPAELSNAVLELFLVTSSSRYRCRTSPARRGLSLKQSVITFIAVLCSEETKKITVYRLKKQESTSVPINLHVPV